MSDLAQIAAYTVSAVAFIIIIVLMHDGSVDTIVEMTMWTLPESKFASVRKILRRSSMLTKERTVLEALKRMEKAGKVECLYNDGVIVSARLTAFQRLRHPQMN